MSSSVVTIWKKADAVCFDVDSTVIREEAIDQLAKFCGKGREIESMYDYFMLYEFKYFCVF